MAVLLRIYDLAEFNRFGLTREIVLAEIVDYLGDAQAAAEVAASAAADGDADLTGEKSLQEFASWLLRRLAESGWIEREQSADYTEYIILPDYAFTLLEAFRAIGQQRPREYTGQLYAAHQLLTSEHEEFSPALAVTQAYESVRGLVRGLNELNQNIRRYTDRVTKDKAVPELMRMQFDDYAPALGAAYHALKTSDHVSRYRRDIIGRLEAWLLDGAWLDRAAGDLALQRRLTPAQAEHEINHALRFIVEQLEGLDPLLAELDRRHSQYLRTSLRQVRYQMGSADGNFKERLVGLAQGLARLQEDGLSLLPEDAPGPRQTPFTRPIATASTPCPPPARRLHRRSSPGRCSTRATPRRCASSPCARSAQASRLSASSSSSAASSTATYACTPPNCRPISTPTCSGPSLPWPMATTPSQLWRRSRGRRPGGDRAVSCAAV